MAIALQRHSVNPSDTGAALINPGMGWVLHFYDNGLDAYGARLAPSDTVADFPGLSVIYLRLAWAYLEPSEGCFNWSLIDAPAQRWLDQGRQVAFRISCSEWMPYATPQWVKEAGAQGHDYTPGVGVTADGAYWEPDYDDPVFLKKLDNFLAVAAARYDGDPGVAFFDVGSFGIWGEGHTFWSTKLPYSADTIRTHIDLHTRHFRQTLLVANHTWADHGRGPSSVEYACREGLTLRSDSILVLSDDSLYHPEQAAPYWDTQPIILESQHYGMSVTEGVWGDGSGYERAVREYHASYASIHWWPREFLAENTVLVDRINRCLGYRLQVREAQWSISAHSGGTLTWQTRWRNAGVAPCLHGGFPCLTLKDAESGIVGVFVDEQFDVATLQPQAGEDRGEDRCSQVESLVPETLPPGDYRVFVSVGTRTGSPRLALPLADDDGMHRYPLGSCRIEPLPSG